LLFVKMAPIKQRAAFVSESGLTFGLVDVPKPGPGQVLVKVVAAAQNPTDCQSRFAAFSLSLSSEIASEYTDIRIAFII
jgi:NADPH:quinone reductase-like Zn-dependent oxidoreductase